MPATRTAQFQATQTQSLWLRVTSHPSNDLSQKPFTFKSVFQTMLQTYGREIHEPSPKDLTIYKRFVTLGKMSGHDLQE
ncbi:hypothetical protein MRX96_013536 [Rhipicephalus microplus]